MTAIEPAEGRERLDVLHLDHSVEPGGAELALRRLLLASGRSWRASLFTPNHDGAGVFDSVEDDQTVLEQVGPAQAPGAASSGAAGAARFGLALVRMAYAIRRAPGLRSADVVHANSTRSAVYAALALQHKQLPLVVHLRDRIEPESLGNLGYRLFRGLVVPRTQAFIANSMSTAETARELAPRDTPIHVIPSPIGVERRQGPLTSATSTRVRILMVARIDSWKGQREVIEAFALAGLDATAELVLVGDAAFGKSEYLEEIRAVVEQRQLRNVVFAGFVEDVQKEIDNADICVQYSIRPEPLGQNVLQYLARGRAVIAADEGGPREWIVDRSNGLLVPPRSPSALGEAMRLLSTDRGLRQRLAERARETDRLPTDEVIAEQHAAAFRGAADRRL